MNDLKWIEANISETKRLLKKRGNDQGIDELVDLFKKRRELILFSEDLKRNRNEINEHLKNAEKSEIEKRRESLRELSCKIKIVKKSLLRF